MRSATFLEPWRNSPKFVTKSNNMATVEKKETTPDGGELTNLLKKGLKNLFYTNKQVPVVDAAQPAASPATAAKVEPASASGVIVEENIKKLWELLEQHDQPGFDFLEFNRLLNSKRSIRDVDKYTDVYETAKALDNNNTDMRAKLLSSAEGYLQILMQEKKDFEKDFAILVDEEVGEKKKEQNALLQEVETLEQQRAELDRQISSKDGVLAGLEDEVAKKEIELQRQSKNFVATLDAVVSDITTKMEGIKMHIPEEKPTETKQD